MISSRRNSLVRLVRSLSSREGRDKSELILLEGTNLFLETLKTSQLPREIIATTRWLEEHYEILENLPEYVPIRTVTEDVLEFALTTKNPDGVATLYPQKALPKPKNKPNFILALDRLQDPGNMGSVFRTALAADVEMIWLALGADPLSPKVLRSSAGSVLKMPFLRFQSSEEESLKIFAKKLEFASSDGYQLVATVLSSSLAEGHALPYWEINWEEPTILVLGNEGSGLHPLIKSICKKWVTVPHSKEVESLNVASVAVPMLLERRRAKMTLR
mgnify:CR=1 FL=1